MASVYVHIPFCERKCPYCDFYSVEGGADIDRFLRALAREAPLVAAAHPGGPYETLYLGGGTPSLLTPGELSAALAAIRGAFEFSPHCEVTLEVNPGTIDRAKLRAMRSMGVTRLSIGVQSFRDDELRFLGRIHSAADAGQCVRDARDAGFDNISIDLIYALSGQTADAWRQSLAMALALAPEHISAYSLIIEAGTPFAAAVREGRWSPGSDEEQAALFEVTMDVLGAAGYEHYEVSNYARPGFHSRHNSAYWTHAAYLGLGPSAHSFAPGDGGGTRWWNLAALGPYIERLEEGGLPIASRETLDGTRLANERIFLGLRNGGVDLDALPPGSSGLVDAVVADGLAVRTGGRLRLTRQGYLLCDEIARRLMVG